MAKKELNASKGENINLNNVSGNISDTSFVDESNGNILKEIEEVMTEGGYRKNDKTDEVKELDDGADAQVFDEKGKKTKKKKKKKNYEHTTLAHKMRVLGVLLVLGIFTGSGLGVWYFNFELRSNFNPFDFNASDYVQEINYTFEKNDIGATKNDGLGWVDIAKSKGLTPLDLTPADNYVLAEYNTSLADTFVIDGKGKVVAMGQPQNIISRKKKKGKIYTFESISPAEGLIANFISDIILMDVYDSSKPNQVDLYKSSKRTPTKADWKKDKTVTKEEFAALSGALPNAVSAYIISEKTVKNNDKEIIKYNEDDGTYTFTMQLDKQLSVINYSKQVKRTGGLGGYPEFQFINFEVTIDGNWNLLSFTITERYKAIKGISVECNGKLSYTVSINEEVEMPV